MDKLELLESIRNITKTTTDTTINYATKSIVPELYADKTELLIFALIGFSILVFYYFKVVRNKSKGN
jgi:hypothetical protein